jgi:RNA polymerase sporulation-specific sigma factor
MDPTAQPGSATFSTLYAPLLGTDPDDSVLPGIAKATSFLARRLAQGTIAYEDLMQEGLLACVLAVHSFDPAGGAAFPTYALHCARNRMLDYVRREKRAAKNVDSGDTVIDDDTNETLFDRLPGHSGFLDNPENQTLVSQLKAAIRRLPDRERLCVELFFREGLLQEDIAARLGVRRARVGQLLAQAIGRLRSSMTPVMQLTNFPSSRSTNPQMP